MVRSCDLVSLIGQGWRAGGAATIGGAEMVPFARGVTLRRFPSTDEFLGRR